MRIEWTDPALDALEEIRDYIAKDSPDDARRFIERIFDATEALTDHPLMGRPVPEANRQDVRELVYQGYRVIYRTRPQHVEVIAVVHGSRDLAKGKVKPWDLG
jgi:toxin ParE1/3/4